jgi:hypothetical protein
MFGLNEKKQFTFEIENYQDFSEKIVNLTDAKRCTIKKLTNSFVCAKGVMYFSSFRMCE